MISDAELLEWMKADSSDTATLRLLEKAAIKAIENRTGKWFGLTTTLTEITRFKSWPIALAQDPVSFTSLSQFDGSAWSVIPSTDYYIDGSLIYPNNTISLTPSYLVPSPSQRMKAIYTAGYTESATNVWPAPDDIQMAVRLLVGHWFENRESVVVGTNAVEIPMTVEMLIEPYKRAVC